MLNPLLSSTYEFEGENQRREETDVQQPQEMECFVPDRTIIESQSQQSAGCFGDNGLCRLRKRGKSSIFQWPPIMKSP
jgi:hypothetical protein